MILKKLIIIPLLLPLFALNCLGQQDYDITLRGMGYEGDVRLVWYPYEWPEGMQGFKIMRRVDKKKKNGKWVELTQLIEPGNTLNKDLSPVEIDPAERKRIEDLRQFYMEGKAPKKKFDTEPLTKGAFLEAAQEGAFLFGHCFLMHRDYDYARMHGCGYIDRNVPKAKVWEYGLFGVWNGKEELIKTYTWEYGSTNEINVDAEIKFRPLRDKKRMYLEFEVNYDMFEKQSGVRGVSVYRKEDDKEWEPMLEDAMISGIDGVTTINRKEKDLNDSTVYTYQIAINTIFNTRKVLKEKVHNPDDIPGEISEIKVVINTPKIKRREQGVNLSWNFSDKDERFVQDFVLLRKSDNKVDTLAVLPSSARDYTDQGFPIECLYYNYQIIARLKNNYGHEYSIWEYCSIPFIPPVPRGIKAEYKKATDREYILITWAPKDEDDTLTNYFKVVGTYHNDTNINPTLVSRSNPLSINSLTFELPVKRAMHSDIYGYSVVALYEVEKSREYWGCYENSAPSELVYVSIPSSSIAGPDPVDKEKVNDKQARIYWKYTHKYWDHAGFKIYMDGKLLADTSILGPDTREYITPELPKGRHYFIVKAVTLGGIESRKYNNCETSFLAK